MWENCFNLVLVSIPSLSILRFKAYSFLNQNIGITDDSDGKAITIVKQFILDSPTIGFDGLPHTLKVIYVKILESSPVQLFIIINSDLRRAENGDRTGHQPFQIITSYMAVAKVVGQNIESVELEGKKGMIKQDVLSPSLA